MPRRAAIKSRLLHSLTLLFLTPQWAISWSDNFRVYKCGMGFHHARNYRGLLARTLQCLSATETTAFREWRRLALNLPDSDFTAAGGFTSEKSAFTVFQARSLLGVEQHASDKGSPSSHIPVTTNTPQTAARSNDDNIDSHPHGKNHVSGLQFCGTHAHRGSGLRETALITQHR